EAERHPLEQVDAREAGPVSVRREKLHRLLRLDVAAAPQARQELHQAEIADEPALGAPEPLEADHADRPGAEARLAAESRRGGCRRQVVQALQLERAADPD